MRSVFTSYAFCKYIVYNICIFISIYIYIYTNILCIWENSFYSQTFLTDTPPTLHVARCV